MARKVAKLPFHNLSLPTLMLIHGLVTLADSVYSQESHAVEQSIVTISTGELTCGYPTLEI